VSIVTHVEEVLFRSSWCCIPPLHSGVIVPIADAFFVLLACDPEGDDFVVLNPTHDCRFCEPEKDRSAKHNESEDIRRNDWLIAVLAHVPTGNLANYVWKAPLTLSRATDLPIMESHSMTSLVHETHGTGYKLCTSSLQ
jgi:hypothetical protein